MFLEICYLLRAYERHGRPGLKNPWSLRQALVYQKYNDRARTSVWIFIQLFKRSKGILWDEISRQDCIHHPVNLHAILLGTALSNWRWFLNDQRRLIESYVSAIKYLSSASAGDNDELERESIAFFSRYAFGGLRSYFPRLPTCGEAGRCTVPISRDSQINQRNCFHASKLDYL